MFAKDHGVVEFGDGGIAGAAERDGVSRAADRGRRN